MYIFSKIGACGPTLGSRDPSVEIKGSYQYKNRDQKFLLVKQATWGEVRVHAPCFSRVGFSSIQHSLRLIHTYKYEATKRESQS